MVTISRIRVLTQMIKSGTLGGLDEKIGKIPKAGFDNELGFLTHLIYCLGERFNSIIKTKQNRKKKQGKLTARLKRGALSLPRISA